MKRNIILFSFVAASFLVVAQKIDKQQLETQFEAPSEWSLADCVAYAKSHSYDAQRAQLAQFNAFIARESAKVAFTPSLNAGVGQDFSFGLAQGADNVKQNRTQASTGFNASLSMPLFSGLKITNQIKRTKIDVKSAEADFESVKEQVELNVMGQYYQVLYYYEMQRVNESQLQLTDSLLLRTDQLIEAGKMSEGDIYEVMAQRAQNEQSLVESQNSYRLALLDLCQLMNYRDVDNFKLDFKSVDASNEDILLPLPAEVYASSLRSRPSLRAQALKEKSAELAVKEAKADYFPQLSLNASWGTGYYHVFNQNNPAFGNQFVNNGSEMVGVQLSIPIYNRMGVRHSVERQRVALLHQQVATRELQDKIYKEIETAYHNAVASRKKHEAVQASLQSNAKALEFAQQKYELGRLSAYELNEVMLRYHRSQIEELQARYDLSLRSQIVMFYAR